MAKNKFKSGKQLKVVILGEGGVGKTSFLKTLLGKDFQDDESITVGIDFNCTGAKTEINGKDYLFNLMFWDLGGQDRFKIMHSSYVLGAYLALLMYDISSYNSARPENLQFWCNLIREQKIPYSVFANKMDKVAPENTEESSFVREDIEGMVGYPPLNFWKGSAKEDLNVKDFAKSLFNKIFQEFQIEDFCLPETALSVSLFDPKDHSTIGELFI